MAFPLDRFSKKEEARRDPSKRIGDLLQFRENIDRFYPIFIEDLLRNRTVLTIFLLAFILSFGLTSLSAEESRPGNLDKSSISFDPDLGALPISTATAIAPDPTPPDAEPTRAERAISPKSKIILLQVDGNRNIKERVILAQVKSRRNEFYDADKLRKDVQAIYGLGNFDDVTLVVNEQPEGVVVTFQVVEKPLIKKIEFKGNKKLSRGKLSDTITLKENDPLDRLKMNADVDKLLTLYKDEGFAAAQVEPFTTADPTNKVTLTFFITEGTRVLIDQVVVEGVRAFPEKKIRKLMKTRRKKVFKQDILTKDLEEITRHYKDNGYMNIHLAEVKQEFNEDKTRLTITVPVEEGPLFKFGETRFSGNAIYPSDQLLPQIQYKPGEIYKQKTMNATLAKLSDLYGAQGYIRVQIIPDYQQHLSSGVVDVDFKIHEGEVVYVNRIGVEGNVATKDFVIRREIKLKEGEPFSSVAARKSVERLYNLGFLDNVDVDVQQPDAPNKADVIFTITEGKPGVLSAGAGYSSVDGLIGTTQIQHTNFLGRAQRLNLMWEFGKRRNSFSLGWTEPWFLGRPLTLGAEIFNVTRRLQYGSIRDAYKTRDRGGSLTMGPRFSDIYNLLFTYSYADRLRFDVDQDPIIRREVLGTACAADPACNEFKLINSNVTAQFIRDTRDNQFDPTRGQRSSFAMTEGGLFPADSIRFYKPVVDHSIHIPTFWKFVLSIHGNWAMVKPWGKAGRSEILDELFRVGGADTVRGYELGSVGVRNGGEIMNVYNIEYKFPIAPDENGRTLLQGVLFYDIGGSWNRISEVSYAIGPQSGLKQGVGFGIRFKTPVFPLRLDWGYGLDSEPGDKPSQFYFTVGSLF